MIVGTHFFLKKKKDHDIFKEKKHWKYVIG